MFKKLLLLITSLLLVIFLSACKSDSNGYDSNDYDEVIDQIFEEVQKFNDDDDYLYIHGGRDESNTYVYLPEGYEDEGLLIRVYYPYEEKKTGKKGYDESWYVFESATKRIKSGNIPANKMNDLDLQYKEIKIDEKR